MIAIDLKICPKEKPFVFNDGTSCCKVYYRTNTNAICDGGFLALEDPLECCPENEYEDCENEPGYCQDHSIASSKMRLIMIFEGNANVQLSSLYSLLS